jgi:hypothetical protein
MSETWKDIPGYEGLYQASSHGQIASLRRGHRILRQTPHYRWGHRRVSLSQAGMVKVVNVHRLVALTFLGEPTGPLVRHLDGDPANNIPANLAYGTSSENNRDTVRHGHNSNAARSVCQNGHEFTPENTYMRGTSRTCRACNSAAVRRYSARQREARS